MGKPANIFYEKMGEKVASICSDKLKHSDKIPEDLANAHISSTFSDALNYWAKNKFKESPETITKYFVYLAKEAFIIN